MSQPRRERRLAAHVLDKLDEHFKVKVLASSEAGHEQTSCPSRKTVRSRRCGSSWTVT